MKRAAGIGVILLFALNCLAFQITINPGGSSIPKKTPRVTSRTLSGTVMDKSDHPIENAVVYIKNMKTLAVKSYFSQKDGAYRFPELATNLDYEVYAEKDGKKSDMKTMSQFDDRAAITINLKIDTSK